MEEFQKFATSILQIVVTLAFLIGMIVPEPLSVWLVLPLIVIGIFLYIFIIFSRYFGDRLDQFMEKKYGNPLEKIAALADQWGDVKSDSLARELVYFCDEFKDIGSNVIELNPADSVLLESIYEVENEPVQMVVHLFKSVMELCGHDYSIACNLGKEIKRVRILYEYECGYMLEITFDAIASTMHIFQYIKAIVFCNIVSENIEDMIEAKRKFPILGEYFSEIARINAYDLQGVLEKKGKDAMVVFEAWLQSEMSEGIKKELLEARRDG